jgi:hypothetical protein
MVQKFEMSMMGELRFQMKQLQKGTFISLTKYIQDILKKFGMKDAKPIKTPMGINGHLDLDTGGKSVDQKVYRSMIGSLLYLCASRLDIIVMEPPKSLGPPTVVLVQRTSDNPVGAHESLDKFGIYFSYLSQERFTRHADITDHRRYENAEAIT